MAVTLYGASVRVHFSVPSPVDLSPAFARALANELLEAASVAEKNIRDE